MSRISAAFAAIAISSSALPAAKADDIVDTAVKAGSFKTLVAAAGAAGLAPTLKGKGPLTVFAPTDDAFAKLPKGTVESLLKPENKKKLAAILAYHVVPGRYDAARITKSKSKHFTLKTAGGAHLPVNLSKGVVVGGANVIKTDIAASNGIIHVIDTVMLPPTPKKAKKHH
ncbi:MAG TPA: fasciclin domain-containing protein [Hyphomicrobiaceae bacterium]|nr:fasciclin domain-containing protein [Hyphomicrobiaceae bacterium]